MTDVILFIGFCTIFAGGILIASFLLWFSLNIFRDQVIRLLNLNDLREASVEWIEAHPERAARYRKRNGIEDQDVHVEAK
jgi:hypothetical protein